MASSFAKHELTVELKSHQGIDGSDPTVFKSAPSGWSDTFEGKVGFVTFDFAACRQEALHSGHAGSIGRRPRTVHFSSMR